MAPRKTVYKGDAMPPMYKAFLGDLKKFREDAGLTPAEAAIALGVTTAKIYTWENGHSIPHPYDLCEYLKILGVNRITLTK